MVCHILKDFKVLEKELYLVDLHADCSVLLPNSFGITGALCGH